jgi:hypothetical protein
MKQGPYSQYLTSSLLMNEPSKPECYITQGWNGLLGTNTLAYWAHALVMKKVKLCELVSQIQEFLGIRR